MKKYQDILRAQTSKNFASKRVTTSMLMLPLRLESKIMNRAVDVIDEPERALLAFRALDELVWDYYKLLNFRSKSRIEKHTRNLKNQMQEVVNTFQQIDLLYAQDKSYLTDLTKNIYNSFHTQDLKNAFVPVLDTLKDITPLKTYSDNPATDYINQVERITRMLENTLKNPLFCGSKRLNNHNNYSQTARYRLAYKRFKEINSWFEGRPGYRRIEVMANGITTRMITNSQADKYNRLMHRIRKVLWTNDSSQISNYQSFLKRFENIYKAQEPIPGIAGHSREKNKVYHYNRMIEMAGRLYNNVSNFIRNGDSGNVYFNLSRKSMNEPLIRYTLLVSKLIKAELMMVKAKTAENWGMRRSAVKEAYRSLSNLSDLISKTYFINNEQRNFVHDLFNFINSTRINNPAGLVSKYCEMLNHCLVLNPKTAPAKIWKKSLCLRIYPDIVALSQIIKQISREECLAGKDFWLKYIFNDDEKYRHSLWLALCDIYPAHRAAFIIKCTYPKADYAAIWKKAQEHHTQKRTLDDFIKEIDNNFVNAFPMTGVDNGEQLFSVPVTNLLPDRFVVHATVKTRVDSSRTIVRYGHRLPKQLQIGIDLNNLDGAIKETDTQLYLNGSLGWMTDYDEAERMGMAITIPLTHMFKGYKNTPGRKFEFKQIFVYGISSTPIQESDKMIRDMLTTHLYSDKAMDVISFETASNIITSEDAKYAFDSSENKQRERFQYQPHNCINPHVPEEGSDLDILDRLFCLSESVLGNLDDPSKPGSSEVELQRYVNKMMIDYLTDSALESDANPLLQEIRNNPILYDFLCKDVLPRGPFPMLRIGDQPYGILPACDLRNLALSSSCPLAIVKKLLLALTTYWNYILDNNIVTCYGKDSDNRGATITTEDYLRILGNTPRSTSFYKRKMVKGGLIDADIFRGETVWHPIEDLTKIAQTLGLIKGYNSNLIKSIIPDYDFVPVSDKYATNNDDACFVVQDALDIDNIVKHIISGIKQYNSAKTARLRLSESTDLIRSYVIEFFDIFNYRLDAWLMGLLNYKIRMRMMRGTHRLALGCFGWLFNLKEVDDFSHGCTDEYIIAPSINQAITGAILRSSYSNSLKNGKAHNYDMSVNLSSERVRTAIRIIEGIQNGLSLGCILGADMERLIHDAHKTTPGELELDSCIYPLRQRYPLMKNDQDNAVNKDAPVNITVLNGARLLDEYAVYKNRGNSDVESWLKNTLNLFAGNDKQDKKIKALMNIIDIIDDEKDALTDVVLTESVYKLTQGNTEASTAITRALKELKNIPMPEVAEIPITSAQIDGYMLAMLPAEAVCDKPDSLLASVEPKVEAWLQRMMHTTDKIYMRVKFPVSGSRKLVGALPSLGSLGISTSEMVYLSADKASFTHFVEVLSWMKTGVFREYDCESPISSDDVNLHAFSECSMAIDELRKVLAAARPLTNDDLVKRTGMPSAAVYNDMSNQYQNVTGYISRLLVNIQQLIERQSAIQNPANSDYEMAALPDEIITEAVKVLIDCYRIGNSMALDAVNNDILIGDKNAIDGIVDWKNTVQAQHALFQSMQLVYDNLQAKLAQADKLVADDPEHKYTTYVEAIKTLLVSGYLIVPSFRPDDNVPIGDLAEQARGKRFLNITDMELETMIGDLARVEQPMMNLYQVRLYQKCDDIDVDRIVPMQLASIDDNTNVRQWLGTAVASEDDVMDAFTYMVMNPKHIIDAANHKDPVLAGIVIDHWIERIPYREQTAAVAFGYDQPDAEAPQTLLLAVATKDNKKHWNEKMLANSLKSAIHMAKCRTVSPDMLCKNGWTGAIFPLLEYRDPKSRR